MIKIDGKEINVGSFPDGTALIKFDPSDCEKRGHVKLSWYYENDAEFLTLVYMVKHLRAHGVNDISLYMPYIPNARMDRVKSNEDVFTLKYFAEMLNSLNFTRIEVLDPHSSVSEALIDNLIVITPEGYIRQVLDSIPIQLWRVENHMTMEYETKRSLVMFYPDEGACKRYSSMVNWPYAFGIKKRDWKTGKIEGLDVVDNGNVLSGKDILIVDDICSRGGTFYHSAKKLKELGVKDIYLYISHCENTILDGDLLKDDLIKKVFTTHSLFTKEHEKIEVFK